QNGIPEDFFYMAVAESNLANASSPVGAQGFWQFMKPTARHYGLEISETVDERFHPTKATYAAVRYLKDLYREFGDWTLVAAAYNMGSPRLHRAIKAQGTDDYFALKLNRETSRYIYRILSFKSLLEEPWRYGIALEPQELYNPIPYRKVEITESNPNLATFAQEQGVGYLKLRTLNPWLITHHLDVPAGKSYEIRLPIQENLQAHELFVDHAPGPIPTDTPPVELEETPVAEVNTSTSDA
ncbi:MAG: lytic transglycosylase domain-containing protein, partial [Bacteroidota bacterium]